MKAPEEKTMPDSAAYFAEITQVPRPSKHEEKIRAYLCAFAQANGLPCTEDAIGNILITRPAAPKLEEAPTVVLQAHMDMVPEAEAGKKFDFLTQPLSIFVCEGWMHADGTTLGADDGAGMALMLSALTAEDEDLTVGRLECLFTVDEEEGMTGAVNLSPDMLSGTILLNLDHEDGDSILTGCAGGVISEAFFTPETEPAGADRVWFRLTVSGLLSGHSGIDIAAGRANALKIAAGFFAESDGAVPASFTGGTKSNVIPKEADVLFSVAHGDEARLEAAFAAYERRLKTAYSHTDAGITLRLERAEAPQGAVWTEEFARRFVRALHECPSGVLEFADERRKQVLTSTNLAAAANLPDGRISVLSLQRSADDTKRDACAAGVAAVFEKAGAEVKQYGRFPGWLLPKEAPLIQKAAAVYERLSGRKPNCITTHGGVECGMIQGIYPHMQIISLGPTILGCHTPEEQLSLESLKETERFLFALLRELSSAKD